MEILAGPQTAPKVGEQMTLCLKDKKIREVEVTISNVRSRDDIFVFEGYTLLPMAGGISVRGYFDTSRRFGRIFLGAFYLTW